MFELGKRVIVYENFFPQDEDDDKEKGQGGYFTTKEWEAIFKLLKEKYIVKFIKPRFGKKSFEEIKEMLRQSDSLCFSVEKKHNTD